MKKIICLVGIIFTFALLCVLMTGCSIYVVNGTGASSVTTLRSSDTSKTSATSGTTQNTTVKTTQNFSALTTEETTVTTKATSVTTVTTKATSVTSVTTKATSVTTKATTATTVTPKNITIFVDAGHGGKDPGAASTLDGEEYHEANINLAVALEVQKELEKRGYTVVMSRSDDTFVELDERVNMAMDAEAAMFISIHCNTFSNSSAAGPRMYYTGRDGLSYNAQKFAAYFVKEFDDIRSVTLSTDPSQLAYPYMKAAKTQADEDILGKDKYYAVLAAKKIPSVLIEMGFMTNDNDLAMLKSPWWQLYVARAIADAVDVAYADGFYAK